MRLLRAKFKIGVLRTNFQLLDRTVDQLTNTGQSHSLLTPLGQSDWWNAVS
jgi:hypothetical protein